MVNSNGKLWTNKIIMCQYWFMNYNKCTALIHDVNNRGNCDYKEGMVYRNSVYFLYIFSVNL